MDGSEWPELKGMLLPGPSRLSDLRFDPQAQLGDTGVTMQMYAPILTCDGIELQTNSDVPLMDNGDHLSGTKRGREQGDGDLSQGDTQPTNCPWTALSKLLDIALHISPAAGRRC